jgi:hypothetical protein
MTTRNPGRSRRTRECWGWHGCPLSRRVEASTKKQQCDRCETRQPQAGRFGDSAWSEVESGLNSRGATEDAGVGQGTGAIESAGNAVA